MIITLLGATIILLTAIFIASPLLRDASRVADDADSGEERREAVLGMETKRDHALASLRDAEMDHATGKLSDDDYKILRGELETAAMEAIDQLDSAQTNGAPSSAPEDPGFCVACGATRKDGHDFCGQCGQSQVR